MAQKNPFVSGLESWASAMDPETQAKGMFTSQSIENKQLEARRMQGVIAARDALLNDPRINNQAKSFILANENFNPESAQKTYRNEQAATVLTDPSTTTAEKAAWAVARGDTLTPPLIGAIEGRPVGDTPTPHKLDDGTTVVMIADPSSPNGFKIVKVGDAKQRPPETWTDASGQVNQWLPDPTQKSGFTYVPIGSKPPAKTVVVQAGGQAFTNTPEGLIPQQVIRATPKPLTPQQIIAANAVNNRNMLGRNFENIENEIGKELGYVNSDGVVDAEKAKLNPWQLKSVMRLAGEYIAAGYLTKPAIQQALLEHGISKSNLVEKEFEGSQSGWWNPQMDAETQQIPGKPFRIALPDAGLGNDVKLLATQGANFYDDPNFNPSSISEANKAIGNENISSRPKLRERFEEQGFEPMPVTALSRLTNLGDDVLGATSNPVRARVFKQGSTVVNNPGEFFVKVDKSGKRTYGISSVDANGQSAILWDE